MNTQQFFSFLKFHNKPLGKRESKRGCKAGQEWKKTHNSLGVRAGRSGQDFLVFKVPLETSGHSGHGPHWPSHHVHLHQLQNKKHVI